MLKRSEKTRLVLKPFVVAYAEDATKPTRRAGGHLTKDRATKEVLKRLMARVKDL